MRSAINSIVNAPSSPDLVEVQVDADLFAFGEAEDDVEVGHRVAIEGARVDAADEVDPGVDGGAEQRRPSADRG